MSIIGVDFGSSYTSASWLNPKSGCPEAIYFSNDHIKIPSLLLATANGFLVGTQARTYLEELGKLPVEQRFDVMDNFVPCLKSLLEDDNVEFLYEKPYTHQKLLEVYFQEIITQAKKHCGGDYNIESVVFTHPVDFSDEAKGIIRRAFENLGLNVVRCLPEPESAVRGYALNHEVRPEEGILVFDFGGGTTDVAYVRDFSGEVKVATIPRGNSHCGGNDIDQAIYEHFRNRIKKELNYDVTQRGMVDNAVLSICRKLKEQFSGCNDSYEIPSLLVIEGHLVTYKFRLSRESFNSIIYPKVHEAIDVVKQVIADVRQKGYKMDRALLIGGSSQLTLVQDELSRLLGEIPIDTFGEKDIAVALGTLADCTSRTANHEDYGTVKQEVDMSVFVQPLKRIVNCIDGGGCPKCGNMECYKLKEPKGEYRCLKPDCGWQGKNIIVSF